MSLLYLYRFKFAVKLQIILFENTIIGHFAIRAVSGQFWPCCSDGRYYRKSIEIIDTYKSIDTFDTRKKYR